MRDSGKVFAAAVALLARREHGAKELTLKLIQKGYAETDILVAISECQRLALQSDVRYVEALSRTRVRQGYGPERIRYELQQKHIASDVITDLWKVEQIDWVACALQVLQKKYKSLMLNSYHEQQKQKQFLHYRGFSNDTIAQVFAHMLEGCDNE